MSSGSRSLCRRSECFSRYYCCTWTSNLVAMLTKQRAGRSPSKMCDENNRATSTAMHIAHTTPRIHGAPPRPFSTLYSRGFVRATVPYTQPKTKLIHQQTNALTSQACTMVARPTFDLQIIRVALARLPRRRHDHIFPRTLSVYNVSEVIRTIAIPVEVLFTTSTISNVVLRRNARKPHLATNRHCFDRPYRFSCHGVKTYVWVIFSWFSWIHHCSRSCNMRLYALHFSKQN